MDIHVLDWIMYFVVMSIIWKIFIPEDYKHEIGLLAGLPIMFLVTISYCIIFWFYNWIDIFNAISFNFQL